MKFIVISLIACALVTAALAVRSYLRHRAVRLLVQREEARRDVAFSKQPHHEFAGHD